MSNKYDFKVATVNNQSQTQLIVPPGASASPIFDCGGCAPSGLILPSTFTACNISFAVSKYGTPGTFNLLVNFDGSALAIAAGASSFLPLLPALFNAVNYFVLDFSNAQTSGGTIDVALSPYFQGIHN